MSTLVVSAEINYDKNNGYDVGEGVMISSTQMFNDRLVSNSGSNIKYDTGSSKTGTIVFDGDSSDKQLESVINIFGNQYKYDGVIDYAGCGKGKDTLKLTIKISSEKNYYAYVLVPGEKDIFMWIDDTGASTAAGSKNYKTPSFTA